MGKSVIIKVKPTHKKNLSFFLFHFLHSDWKEGVSFHKWPVKGDWPAGCNQLFDDKCNLNVSKLWGRRSRRLGQNCEVNHIKKTSVIPSAANETTIFPYSSTRTTQIERRWKRFVSWSFVFVFCFCWWIFRNQSHLLWHVQLAIPLNILFI